MDQGKQTVANGPDEAYKPKQGLVAIATTRFARGRSLPNPNPRYGNICATSLDIETLDLGTLTVLEMLQVDFDCWPNIARLTTMLNTLPKPSLLRQMTLTTAEMSRREDWRSGDQFSSVVSDMVRGNGTGGMSVVIVGGVDV
ncbi:hypothetical protein LshimejAT787_0312310 [Lyophyllum shimeji]|uniref:Uncharacterized protein n=1 Tax=Lyophyllum shimeji TaxID=47721 RepID=A0A9P3PK56_LYOSH|nr:hypothetical protein LshimejAT787_0312310 [Lyophyllum shimeji]